MYGVSSSQAKGTETDPWFVPFAKDFSAIVHFRARIVSRDISNQYATTRTSLRESSSCWKKAQTHRQMMELQDLLE